MQCRQPSLEGTGEVPLRRLVKEALRMRPSRILVGEVRQAESLDLLIALNSGLPDNVDAQAAAMWRPDPGAAPPRKALGHNGIRERRTRHPLVRASTACRARPRGERQ